LQEAANGVRQAIFFIKMKLGARYKIEGGTSPSPEGPSVGMELLGTQQQKQQAAPTN